MQETIERYIKVLKDRRKIALEYGDEGIPAEFDLFEHGCVLTLDDIIAELEGFVNTQNYGRMMKEALIDAYGTSEEEWIAGYKAWQAGR
jgi:hypothetical protein